jgi:hypothetical protein
VSLRGRIKLTAPGKFSGQACVSALKGYWREFSSRAFPVPATRHDRSAPSYHSSDPATCSPELRDLIATLEVIRQKMFANSLLRSGVKWFVWLLFGLIAAALVIANFGGAVISIAALAALGVIAIFAWTWRTRPSNYEAARQLDSAAGLKDRLSTATFFGAIDDSDGMVAEQRMEVPGNLRRAGALVLVVTGLFAYRIHHRAPLVAFLQNTARSPLVQSLLTPIAHAMEKDLQRTLALVSHKQDAAADQAQRADAVNTDDLWKSDRGAGSEDQKDPSAANAAEPPQDQMEPDGNQEGDPNGEARQSDSYSQSQQGKNGEENQNGKAQAQQNEQQGPEGRQSLGQSLMQALKNMLSNSPSQQSNNRAQQPNAQGTPQAGNSQQPGQNESDKRGDSRGNSDAKQKASQTASEGAGSQIGSKELRKDQAANPVNAVPDRVALEAGDYKEQTRMKVATETGAAQLADRGLSPRQDAVTNGAEQENIPARYRFYVQRYFEHADSDKH